MDSPAEIAAPDDAVRSIAPESLGVRELYRLLVHCVAPRPIAFVSTVGADGIPNLAPFSYFCLGGANPGSVAISPTTDRHGGAKDTLKNIEATGEYTINVVTHAMQSGMNQTSFEYPHGVSEWSVSGFTSAPAVRVRPARVAESPIALECRLFQIVRHGNGPTSANYVIGEIVHLHIAESLFDPAGEIDATRVDYIGRMGADFYARAHGDALFTLPRPEQG